MCVWGAGLQCVSADWVGWLDYLLPSGGLGILFCGCIRCTQLICLLSVVGWVELERHIKRWTGRCFWLFEWSSQVLSWTRYVSCGFFKDGASHLCGCLCLCVWLTVFPRPHKHTLHFVIFVCVCVCNLVLRDHFNSVSIMSYLGELMAERHACYPAHLTPEAANELLLYTLMKYNCIMVCK